MSKRLTFLLFMCFLASVSFWGELRAEDAKQGKSAPFCPEDELQLCGLSFPERQGPLGTVLTFDLPERFADRTVSVQCEAEGAGATYKLIDVSVLSCELRSCAAAKVTVCGASLEVWDRTPVGEAVRQEIPAKWLSRTHRDEKYSFSASCEVQDGKLSYRARDIDEGACAAFACPPVTLPYCGGTVVLAKSAEAGEVVQAVSDKKRPVMVECAAEDEGAPPLFRITEASKEACRDTTLHFPKAMPRFPRVPRSKK